MWSITKEPKYHTYPDGAVSYLSSNFKKCWYTHVDATLKKKKERYESADKNHLEIIICKI